MVRKEPSKTMKGCYDIRLIPPIRIRNGLPVTMQVKLIEQDYELILSKWTEQHISFYAPDEIINLWVSIDEHKSEWIRVKFFKKALEEKYRLRSENHKNSYIDLYANFSDEKAGWFVTFYVKTCFVNACSISDLAIYDTTNVSILIA
jgi:hypothetical protein